MILSFKEWLLIEAVKLDAKRPYIKSSDEVKYVLEKLKNGKDKPLYMEIKSNLKKFKDKIKSDGKIPSGMHGHVYTQPLTGYTGVHLEHGHWVLLYTTYKGAIFYINLVQHSILEHKALCSKMKPALDIIKKRMEADITFNK